MSVLLWSSSAYLRHTHSIFLVSATHH